MAIGQIVGGHEKEIILHIIRERLAKKTHSRLKNNYGIKYAMLFPIWYDGRLPENVMTIIMDDCYDMAY